MLTIRKYQFFVDDTVTLALPRGAQILSVAKQRPIPGALELWALVNTDEPKEERRLYVRGTGHNAEAVASARFITTVHEPSLVWHIFEEG